jgi:ABC-type glycerol-3-phosphate transport system substrate-binding protein
LYYNLAPFIDSSPDFQKEDFFPGVLEAFRWNGGIWGLAQQIDVNLILYDQSAFEEAGIVPPPQLSGWNQESFLEMAKILTRSTNGAQRYGFVDYSGQGLYGMLNASLHRALDQGRLDTPEMAAVLGWYSDLGELYKVSPDMILGDQRWEQYRALVENEQAAMWSDRLSNYQYYTQQKGRRLGLALIPASDGLTAPAYFNAYFISAGTSHPQEAWLWLAFLSRQRLESGLPNASVGLPPRRSLVESSYWKQFDAQALPTVQYAAEHLAFAPLDPSGAYGYLWNVLQAVHDGVGIENALTQAQQSYAQALAQTIQIPTTPVQVATPLSPPAEAAQIKFFNSGIYDDLLYQLVEKFQLEHPEIQVDVLYYWQYGPQDADCFGSAYLIQDVYDLQPLRWTATRRSKHSSTRPC